LVRAIHIEGPDFNAYAKLLVGDGVFYFPYDYADGSYFVLAPRAGVDVPFGNQGLRSELRILSIKAGRISPLALASMGIWWGNLSADLLTDISGIFVYPISLEGQDVPQMVRIQQLRKQLVS
jgi:hypothetical protein